MKLQYEALLLNFCQLKSFNYGTMFGASGDLISLCKNKDFILLCVTLLRSRVGLVYLHPEFYDNFFSVIVNIAKLFFSFFLAACVS